MAVWLIVAAGGALGSMARHGVNHLVNVQFPALRFPAATVIVNVVGCFVIGLLAGLLASDRIAFRFYWREFVFVGMLGGFTTFSTFGMDTFVLARTHSFGAVLANVGIQVIGGLVAVWIGHELGVKA